MEADRAICDTKRQIKSDNVFPISQCSWAAPVQPYTHGILIPPEPDEMGRSYQVEPQGGNSEYCRVRQL